MKKDQRGSVAIVLASFFGMVTLLSIMTFFYAASLKTSYRQLENRIHANYEDSKNIHSNGVLKIKEMAQVPKMNTEQLSKVLKDTMEGRYGDDGSKAVFQLIKEQNPTVSNELYINLQKEMAGWRTDFSNKSRIVIDSKRVAYNMLDDTIKGFLLDFMNVEPKNIGYNGGKDDYPVIMSAQSSDTFKTGIDNGVNILD